MIVSRKFALPELPDPCLERPGLMRRLIEGLGAGKRATLVQAGPGMGKTALLAGYLRQLHEDGAALALWCELTRADRDAAVFCRRVHGALRRELPELSAQAVEVTATLGHAGLAQAMGLLCDDLEEALGGRALALVLDDAQHLPDDAEFLQGLEALIRYFPDDGQLVLAGRALPPIKLAQFQLRNQLVRLEDADLRFRPGEVADLAALFESGGVAGQDAALIELANRAQGLAGRHCACPGDRRTGGRPRAAPCLSPGRGDRQLAWRSPGEPCGVRLPRRHRIRGHPGGTGPPRPRTPGIRAGAQTLRLHWRRGHRAPAPAARVRAALRARLLA